jgi:hypothetical protein
LVLKFFAFDYELSIQYNSTKDVVFNDLILINALKYKAIGELLINDISLWNELIEKNIEIQTLKEKGKEYSYNILKFP